MKFNLQLDFQFDFLYILGTEVYTIPEQKESPGGGKDSMCRRKKCPKKRSTINSSLKTYCKNHDWYICPRIKKTTGGNSIGDFIVSSRIRFLVYHCFVTLSDYPEHPHKLVKKTLSDYPEHK